ncbi:hypothetical protein EPUS_05579 [Endocarpon pusillum Z07020]|uniref:Large ribosomal subunit protein mL67 n=1 Tax=Endocarpon pusillum (strain Z07020 / HMAS-L-300199) TaxID=1263415 RepID=U1G352_ENDPU|nr:uncharacterized protein EPUS_05579 [Endocarpon pusillum Z07020]ERF71707.1 hypothetical protein EPUS_05579 [Endocarpon pusillum Z07020]
MDILSQGLRPRPQFILCRLHQAPQIRLYTKETLERKRPRRRQQLRKSSLAPRARTINRSEPKPPPPPKPEAFGKPRDASSNAAKAERFKESRRIEKALRHEHHGENVYAYAHIGTGQVVYSLTRVMDNNNILRQLVFHGKKTVPASLRRDLWTPYFSLHFPSSYSGLLAYHQLRELSLQRQLQPPDYLIKTTIQTASKEQRAKMTREEEEKWDEEHEGKPYPDGHAQMAHRRERARKLMNQKATSVADVAFVVDLMQREGHLRSAASVEELMKQRRAERLKEASKRRTKKLRAEWRKEEKREQWYIDMTRKVQEGTKWGLDMYSARRISLEHGGLIVDPRIGRARVTLPGREGDAKEIESGNAEEREGAQESDTRAVTTSPTTEPSSSSLSSSSSSSSSPPPPPPPPAVRILWSDLRDATFAASWPGIVFHGELERLAVSRRPGRRSGDAPPVFVERSVHVMGGMKMGGDEEWMRGSQSRTLWADEDEDGREDTEGDGVEGDESRKSRKERERESVSVEPPPPRRKGVIGWVKGRLGMAA